MQQVQIYLYFSKPKNQRVKRALEKRDPKLVENDKTTMVIKGGHTSDTVSEALKDLVWLVIFPFKKSSLSPQYLPEHFVTMNWILNMIQTLNKSVVLSVLCY